MSAACWPASGRAISMRLLPAASTASGTASLGTRVKRTPNIVAPHVGQQVTAGVKSAWHGGQNPAYRGWARFPNGSMGALAFRLTPPCETDPTLHFLEFIVNIRSGAARPLDQAAGRTALPRTAGPEL